MKALLLAMVAMVYFGCFPERLPEFDNATNSNPSFGYTAFKIDEMPCVVVGQRGFASLAVWNYTGVTCDWSKFKVEE